MRYRSRCHRTWWTRVFVDGGFVSLCAPDVAALGLDIQPPAGDYSNEWECFNIAVLLKTFGSYLANKSVRVKCDNACTVAALRKFAISSSKAVVMADILRCIFRLCVEYNVCLRPKWISGESNVMADALSRQRWAVVGKQLQRYVSVRGYPPSAWAATLEHL